MGWRWSNLLVSASCAATLACGGWAPATAIEPNGSSNTSDTTKIPITDLGARRYLGFAGGLYPGGNEIPSPHLAVGRSRAKAIRPLDPAGNPSPTGKYVLLSIGMSNTTQEFCAASPVPPCASWSFMAQAAADPAVNHSTLVMVNGARGGQTSSSWMSPTSEEYDRIRDTWLTPLGLSERQVQIAWVKSANAQPKSSPPAPDADPH